MLACFFSFGNVYKKRKKINGAGQFSWLMVVCGSHTYMETREICKDISHDTTTTMMMFIINVYINSHPDMCRLVCTMIFWDKFCWQIWLNILSWLFYNFWLSLDLFDICSKAFLRSMMMHIWFYIIHQGPRYLSSN